MSDNSVVAMSKFPALASIVDNQLKVWPGHKKFLETLFSCAEDSFLARCEEVVNLVLILTGNELDQFCADYQQMCINFNAEQKYFARHGEYRLKSFEEAFKQVYSDDVYMAGYVRGILLSQIFWGNHSLAIDSFRTHFLAGNKSGGDYLEVGPGHGLFLYFASRDGGFDTLTGWELSTASIKATQHAIDQFKVTKPIRLIQQDILNAPSQQEAFDVAVISEVLEHLEQPEIALSTLHKSLRHKGRIFINIPINSPAPDHIYLWRTPEEVRTFVEACGFRVTHEELIPVTGYTIEKAMKHKLAVSCVIFAEKV